MFDIGWSELLIIGVVALIVIGPKDLPDMFRTLGRFTAKARSMAREFSRAMESAADEAGVKDVASDLRKVTSAKAMGLDAVKDAASKFEKWDPLKPSKSSGLKPDPDAPKPAPSKPDVPKPDMMEPAQGPATKALADAQVAKRVERAEAVKSAAQPAVATTAKPAVKTAKPKAAAKPAVTAKPATKPVAKATPKPAVKPKAASRKTSTKKIDV
ncbi:Sec-independent protein translocase protein TatB [Pseudorhodobacter sp.]|uniref:Sec-independent protein translocase protein TatB n=1 Tax=Pseudorhodobacter sp. TaxID=1934400 RepID=UPI002647015F|nr:Sec-independent protein translocase protein TatB [Pseudorhodobacter sp.]MDN5786257.1 Sec-independent protein translocase protein TatB [Pseudorhodobacter sp.]